MAGNSLIFKDAEKARDAILSSQKKEIAALYDKWADEIGERAKYYSHKSTASSVVSERQMRELQKQIRATSQEVSNEVYSMIKKNMYTVADSVVQCNSAWLASLGFDGSTINAAFSSVPDDVVRNLLTGQIYDSGWSLSSRIWGDNEDTLKDIYQVMAKGLTENKSIYDIAKELESYVRPGAKLPWNLKMADGAKIYKKQVDYNAQRLARTLTQHGYQQSFIATTQKNPFITDYIWRSNGSRVCELCAERDGKHFKKTELPMDHPNGMCTMEPNIASDMNDQLADWFNSPDGTYPEIDAFASNFGYVPTVDIREKIDDANGFKLVNGKDILGEWKRDKQKFDFEIDDAIHAQGFDGKPRVVTQEEFNQAVKDSKFISQRNYSAADQATVDAYHEQLVNGKWYVDCSTGGAQYGQGMYVAADCNGELTDGIKAEMKHYQELGVTRGFDFSKTETMTLDKSAKIIDFDDAVKETAKRYSKEETERLFALGKVHSEEEGLDLVLEGVNKEQFQESLELRYRAYQAKSFDEQAKLNQEIRDMAENVSNKETRIAIKRNGSLC